MEFYSLIGKEIRVLWNTYVVKHLQESHLNN